MWRSLLTLILAGALGSLIATIAWNRIAGGGAAPIGFALSTMLFSVPGALMLRGLQAILAERALPRPAIAALVIMAGALAGSLILVFIFRALDGMMIGAVYGSFTAVMLLFIQALFDVSRAAIR